MNKFVCIHGHFYQPPRENAWLEDVEFQDSAHPYHDWNERVTAEGYAPNAASRIQDGDGYIIDIVNNYAKISYNFGPTLLSWMQEKRPDVYRDIIQADKESQKIFSGHGSAMAQAFHHIILPLANERDKRTQVLWGIRDFEHRFGRKPEGMWLPETAVDVETLTILADADIKFTILAPHQAARFREIGENDWTPVEDNKIDTTRAYRCELPSGKSIALFFYDGSISHDLSFGNLLENGENFATTLVNAFSDADDAQLVHVATDGETYGHHKAYGDMALAYCLDFIEKNDLARITNYSEFLENHQPAYEVEIVENTSWSCVHGIERWRSDCGCQSGLHDDWTQSWRQPLREAMNWLRDELAKIYESIGDDLLQDPWATRDNYVRVLLDRSVENVEAFFAEQTTREVSDEDKSRLLKLMEMQRHALMIFTSCGWFFDDISGIETTQVIQYAARAIQLAEELSDQSLESEFVKKLEAAPSNIQEFHNGAWVYENFVQPARLDLLRVGVHFAISSIFEDYPESVQIYSYHAESRMRDVMTAGKLKLALGQAYLRSDITWDKKTISFVVLYLSGHILNGAARELHTDEEFDKLAEQFKKAFRSSNIPDILRLMDDEYGTHNFTLWHLFKDERRKIFNQTLAPRLEELEIQFRQIYEQDYAVMEAMRTMNLPLPPVMRTPLEYSLSIELKQVLQKEEIDIKQLEQLVDEIKKWHVNINTADMSLIAGSKIHRMVEQLFENIKNIELMTTINDLIQNLQLLSLHFELFEAQNIYFHSGKQPLDEMKKAAEQGDDFANKWIDTFNSLGDMLRVKLQ